MLNITNTHNVESFAFTSSMNSSPPLTID
jgi:hypothetical protein